MSNGELTRIDGRPISDNREEIRAFLVTWNDSLRLESALKHYRKLGVHRFFVADCGSTDGTLDRLSAAPDVHVFSATGDDSLAWLNTLLDVYGAGHWTLTVDTSEMFIYPHYEELELPLFCRYLNHVGAQAVPCLSLDMYAASPIADAVHRPGTPLIGSCPYFDAAPYQMLNLVLAVVAGLQAPIIMMSQNRQTEKDRLRADLDYQVNLKNELSLTEVLRRLDVIESERLPKLFEEQHARLSLSQTQNPMSRAGM